MKNISGALQTMFNTVTQFVMIDLYTIKLVSGQVLYYTSADISVTWNGHVYTALGPKITRDQIKLILGVQVDQLDVTFFPDTTDTINGQLFLWQVQAGLFDGAWFSLDRLFATSYSTTPTGSVSMFQGLVADCVVGRTSAKLTIKSPLDLLNSYLPRTTYQAGCTHNLFDAGCTLSSSAFAVSGSVIAPAPVAASINCSLNQPAGWFTLGYLTYTSGVNNGLSRGISYYVPGNIYFSYPFPAAPAVGDTFTAYPGCDKQQNTCTSKFNNLAHYRGFPYIPVPETAT
jgi:uncharacterized phage protein (TIGR02218 family)